MSRHTERLPSAGGFTGPHWCLLLLTPRGHLLCYLREAVAATFPADSVQGIQLPVQEKWVRSLGQEDPPEKEMATHSRIPAWEIPQTEEPGVRVRGVAVSDLT